MDDVTKNFDLLEVQDGPRLKGLRYLILDDGNEIIDVDFFKKHARVDFDTDDQLCNAYIKAARQHLERWGQISLNEKTVQFNAVEFYSGYKLMLGPVKDLITSGYSLDGDNISPGGRNAQIQYTTLGMADNMDAKISVCKYATGLYVIRENIIDTKIIPETVFDGAKQLLKPLINMTWF